MTDLDPITIAGLVLSAGGVAFATYAVWLKLRLDRMRRDDDRAHHLPGE